MSIYEHFEHAQNSALHEIRTLVLICQPCLSRELLNGTTQVYDQDVVVMYTLVTIFYSNLFSKIFNFFVCYVYEGYEGECRVFTLRVYVGYLL